MGLTTRGWLRLIRARPDVPNRKIMFKTLVASLSLLLLAPAALAGSRSHALLVGVSEYPGLDKSMWLEGPRNDVQLFRDFLQERGVPPADIRVLADGVSDASDPTRGAILGALGAIAEQSTDGDFVFLLFAGHGSQQPARADDNDEPDGLDEIFLPRDIGRWDGEVAALPNALVDQELGAAINRIRDRGAFVWAVFDNCHSGTITRAMPTPGERDRRASPAALGIPAELMNAAAAHGAATRTRGGPTPKDSAPVDEAGGKHKGGFVAFYAAQSQETTPEALLPLYAADSKPRGLFSYSLYEILSSRPEASYRQVIEQVLQRYQGLGRQQPTPTYAGSDGALDATVFGSSGSGVRQWRLDVDGAALKLRAGLLQQVTPESTLLVVAKPTDPDSAALGAVRVQRASTADSELVPAAAGELAAVDVSRLKGPFYARPLDLKVDFSLRVAMPAKTELCEAPPAALNKALDQLRGNPRIAPRARWVGSNEAADVRPCVRGKSLLLLDGSAALALDQQQRYPGVALEGKPEELAANLGQALERIGRVANLSRLAGQLGGGGAARLEVSITRTPNCAGKAGCQPTPQPITLTDRPSLRDGDVLSISLRNPTRSPVDATVLYVDALYGIGAMFPEPDSDELPRLEAGARKTFTITVQAEPAGFERLLVIGVPVTPQAPMTSFTSLAQSGLGSVATRGAAAGGIQALFEEAAFGSAGQGTTRGGRRESGNAATADFMSFAWEVTP